MSKLKKETIKSIIEKTIDAEKQMRGFNNVGIDILNTDLVSNMESIIEILLGEHFEDEIMDSFLDYTCEFEAYSQQRPLIKKMSGKPLVYDVETLADYMYENQKENVE